MYRSLGLAFGVGLALLVGVAEAGRFEGFSKKVADQGEYMNPVAATYFGGGGVEEFIGAGVLPDGSIVAFGNSTGPDFPAAPKPVVLGQGKHRALNAYGPPRKDGTKPVRADNPDLSGMIVIYGEKLDAVKQVIRFDWGVASITAGCVSPDGQSLYVAGRAGPDFKSFSRLAGTKEHPFPEQPAPDPKAKKKGPPTVGPYDYDGVRVSGDVYLAKIALSTQKPAWIHVYGGLRQAPQSIWLDKKGTVYAEFKGMTMFSPDGEQAKTFVDRGSTGTAHYLAIDPNVGGAFYGGDRNTNTGRQPYRQPYFYKYDLKGEKVLTLWEPVPRECACGGDGNGLCSDSSPRAMDFAPNGDWVIGGWSDGGNTVFTRQPTDWRKGGPRSPLGMDASGMKRANSLSHIMRIDPTTREQKAYELWVAYIPQNFASERDRGAPNHTSIKQLRVLGDGSVAICGSAATGLIQTPNSFYKYPGDGSKSGGSYVAVFSEDFKKLLFSSHLPGCDEVSIVPAKKGVIVVSRSHGSDGAEKPNPSPVLNPLQKEKRGEYDAHIILVQ